MSIPYTITVTQCKQYTVFSQVALNVAVSRQYNQLSNDHCVLDVTEFL